MGAVRGRAGHRHGASETFEVLPGGLMTPRPKMLVFDADADADVDAPLAFPGQSEREPRVTLSEREVAALRRAQDAGLDLAVLTAADEDAARRVCADAGLSVAVVGSAAARSRSHIDRVLDLCHHRGCTLRDVAVIASRPRDISLMLEAGTAYALMDVEGAARDTGAEVDTHAAATAADAMFPPRRQGGLAAAIEAVVALRGSAQLKKSNRSWLTGR